MTRFLTRLLFGSLAWHYCVTLLRDAHIWHFCRALLLGTLLGHSYLTFWLDTLAYLTHVYAGHHHMTIPRNTLLDTLTWHIWSTRHWEPPTTVSKKECPTKVSRNSVKQESQISATRNRVLQMCQVAAATIEFAEKGSVSVTCVTAITNKRLQRRSLRSDLRCRSYNRARHCNCGGPDHWCANLHTNTNVNTQVVDAQTSPNAFIIAATQITIAQTSSARMQRQLVVCGSAGPAKASSRSILRKCQESMSSKGVLQEGQVRVYHESVR